MLELIGVLATAAVALVSTLRWPTLRRRVREHATLLKDLPEDAAAPLRDLLVDEVRALTQDDRDLLNPHLVLAIYLRRTAAVFFMATMLGGAILATTWLQSSETLSPLVIVVLALGGLAAGFTLSATQANRRHRRRLAGRQQERDTG